MIFAVRLSLRCLIVHSGILLVVDLGGGWGGSERVLIFDLSKKKRKKNVILSQITGYVISTREM